LALTPEQEIALGERAYREILDKYRSKVFSSGSDVDRVRRVGKKIERAAEIEPLQREINLHMRGVKFQWEFNVLHDRQINAFCLPGGKVVVFTGLLPVAATDAQLATVIAHEVAHALAHHTSERLARQKSEGGGFIAARPLKSSMISSSQCAVLSRCVRFCSSATTFPGA
jgi:predicted Zn-dependent protease